MRRAGPRARRGRRASWRPSDRAAASGPRCGCWRYRCPRYPGRSGSPRRRRRRPRQDRDRREHQDQQQDRQPDDGAADIYGRSIAGFRRARGGGGRGAEDPVKRTALVASHRTAEAPVGARRPNLRVVLARAPRWGSRAEVSRRCPRRANHTCLRAAVHAGRRRYRERKCNIGAFTGVGPFRIIPPELLLRRAGLSFFLISSH
jgi:hypothetical protein